MNPRDLLDILRSQPRESVLGATRGEILRLQSMLAERPVDASAFVVLNQRRILSSQSLLSQNQERVAWDAGNQEIAREIQAGEDPSLAGLIRLNSVLTGTPEGMRDSVVYAGQHAYPSPDIFPEARELFENGILKESDPLLRAALAYIWVCNIHPFANGNGRTARLFADGLLIREGFLPLCFPLAAAGHVVLGYAERSLSLEEGIRRCWSGIVQSYRIVLA